MKKFFILLCSFLFLFLSKSHADWDCQDNVYRNAYNVVHYDLNINFDTSDFSLSGQVIIRAIRTSDHPSEFQIDLQEPLIISSIKFEDKALKFVKNGAKYLLKMPKKIKKDEAFNLQISYSGIPHKAKNAPWDGGMICTRDSRNKVWWAVACEGIGASVWFPCKDLNSDEPEQGVDLHYSIPNGLVAIGNGRFDNVINKGDINIWHWKVQQPINLYNITFYIGDYVHQVGETFGIYGHLSTDYYVLNANYQKAKEQFKMVPEMINIFEDWMGPYPFYKDGFKLVEAPFLGMEHQSAIAYGNDYQMGYKGTDRSNTGVGLLFDFIIVHESGHEWFGNNISVKNASDIWISEGFTSYTEVMYIDSKFGKEKAVDYLVGTRSLIKNELPLINCEHPCNNENGDVYNKGANLVHMIRTMMNNDTAFKMMLRKMNQVFGLKVVTSKEIENFLQQESKLNLDKVFEQYLYSASLPVLSIHKTKEGFNYSWKRCVSGFDMPVLVLLNGKEKWLYPTTVAQSLVSSDLERIELKRDFYCLFHLE